MDYKSKIAFEQAKAVAQESADTEDQPVHVIERNGNFHTYLGEALPSGVEVLYTAYPMIYEEISPRSAIAYNGNQVRFTTIQAIVDDDGKDAIMETTRELWDVDYAMRVNAFLNRVLGSHVESFENM